MKATGFVNVSVQLKEESREFIKNWLPGSGAEKYVVSANITGRKPGTSAPAQTEGHATEPKTDNKEGEGDGC